MAISHQQTYLKWRYFFFT